MHKSNDKTSICLDYLHILNDKAKRSWRVIIILILLLSIFFYYHTVQIQNIYLPSLFCLCIIIKAEKVKSPYRTYYMTFNKWTYYWNISHPIRQLTNGRLGVLSLLTAFISSNNFEHIIVFIDIKKFEPTYKSSKLFCFFYNGKVSLLTKRGWCHIWIQNIMIMWLTFLQSSQYMVICHIVYL